MRWAVGDGPPQVSGIVGHAGSGVGVSPQFENSFYIFQATRTDGQILDHFRLQKKQEAQWIHFITVAAGAVPITSRSLLSNRVGSRLGGKDEHSPAPMSTTIQ